MDNSVIIQDNCTEYMLISYLYKKSINLLEKQIDQTKNSKDLLIIIYKIYQSILDILSNPDHAKKLYLDYEEFLNIIKYEYSKSKPDDTQYNLEYPESEESFKKEIEDKSYKELVLRLKRKLHHTQEKHRLKEYNYLATINQLMNSNLELKKGYNTFYPLNLKSSFTTPINNWKTRRNMSNNKGNTKNIVSEVLSKEKNKTDQSKSIENMTGYSIYKSSNSISLSSRGRDALIKTPMTMRCRGNDSSDLIKFKLYQRNRCSYVKKNFKLQANIIQIKNIIDSHDKSYTPPNPFKLPIKNYYSSFSNKIK